MVRMNEGFGRTLVVTTHEEYAVLCQQPGVMTATFTPNPGDPTTGVGCVRFDLHRQAVAAYEQYAEVPCAVVRT